MSIFYQKNISIVGALFLLMFLYQPTAFSQFYETGQDPASVHWSQINTKNYQVIFDRKYEDKAQRIANILEYAYDYVNVTLKDQPKKISVILHNHSSVSNGMVAWAPKRVELYPTPGQDIYAQEWLEQLVIHELRHVVQTDKMNQGITEVLRIVFGQQATGAMMAMVPKWFLEGDAVATETALSHSGRGRIPDFEMELRALTLKRKKIYSFEKSVHGSYKDFVPDHYRYGYQLVAYGRNKYGPSLWDSTLDYTARHPYTVFPFFFGMHKYGNTGKNKLYHETFSFLKEKWQYQADSLSYTSFKQVNRRRNSDYISYRFPRYINDSLLVAEKYGPGQIKVFVTLDQNDREKRIHIPGYYAPAKLSAGHDQVVWAQSYNDARWEHRNYYVIKVYDLRTGKAYQITHKTRFFAPDLSPDGKKIVAVEETEDNRYALVILNSFNGVPEKKLTSPGNQMLLHPVWLDNNQEVAVIRLGEKGKSISVVNADDSTWTQVLASSYNNISELEASGNRLFFSGSYSGITNIYALDLTTGERFQVTSSHFGAFSPEVSANGKELIYNDYSSQGYNIVKTALKPEQWIPLNKVKDNSVKLYKKLAEQEKGIIESSAIPDSTYSAKPYRRFTHLFYFHSWLPFYFDYDNLSITDPVVYPGISLLSQNKLGTAVTTLGYARKNGYNYLQSKIVYKGLYPVFEFSGNYGNSPDVIPSSMQDSVNLSHNGLNYTARVYVPLSFQRSGVIGGLTPSVKLNYSDSYFFYNDNNEYNRGITTAEYQLVGYWYQKTSVQDIIPRLGQLAEIRYHTTPQNNQFGTVFSLQARQYLPGLMKHHSILLEAGYQEQKVKRFIYSGVLSFPRGFSHTLSSEKLKTFSANYDLPLWCPDLNISRLLYIKRFRAELFYDYAQGEIFMPGTSGLHLENKDYQSFGTEVTADFHVAQFLFPFNAGIRYSYLPDYNSYQTEFIFNLDLSVF